MTNIKVRAPPSAVEGRVVSLQDRQTSFPLLLPLRFAPEYHTALGGVGNAWPRFARWPSAPSLVFEYSGSAQLKHHQWLQ